MEYWQNNFEDDSEDEYAFRVKDMLKKVFEDFIELKIKLKR